MRGLCSGTRRALIACSAISLLALAGCGDDAPSVGGSPTDARSATSASAPHTSAAASSASLDLTLSGGLTGTVTTFSKQPECRFYKNDTLGGYVYSVTYEIAVDGTKYTFGVLHNTAKKSGEQTAKVADINVHLDTADSTGGWSSFLPKDPATVKGTITIADDRSGTIDATIGSRKDDGRKPLVLKGSWRCSTFSSGA